MYRIDMYYDAGGVLIPLHKPMALITRGLKDAVFVPRRTDVYSRCLHDEWE